MAEALPSAAGDPLVPEFVACHGMLGGLVEAEPVPLAFLNQVWLIRTTRGRFIVKRHVPYVTAARLDWTARFLATLSGRGYPADQIVRAADGAAALNIGESPVTAHTFLDGDCIRGGVARLTAAQRLSAIAGLARYHSIAGSQDGAASPPPLSCAPPGSPDPAGPDPAPLLHCGDMDFIRSYMASRGGISPGAGTVLDACFARLAAFFQDRLYRELPTVIIHGDYRPKNIVFTGDRVTGLFDWDLVQRAPRLVDLCGRFAQHYIGAADRCGDARPLAGYLDTYARAAARLGCPVTAAERAAFPDFLRAGVIQTGAVVSSFIRSAPLMAGETSAQRQEEADRRLALAVEQLRAISALWPASP